MRHKFTHGAALMALALVVPLAGQTRNGPATTQAVIDMAHREKALAYVKLAQEALQDKGDKEVLAAARDNILEVKVRLGEVAEARQMVDELPEVDRVPPLTGMAFTQAEIGDVAGARKTLDDARRLAGPKPSEWNLRELASTEARWGDVTEAERMVRQMTPSWMQVRVWTEVATARAKRGDKDGAKAGFAAARATIKAERNPFGDQWLEIVRGELEAGDSQGAQETIGLIGGEIDRARGLSMLAAFQLDAGDKDGARRTLAAAQNTVPSGDLPDSLDASERVTLLAKISEGLARVGDTEKARDVLAEAARQAGALSRLESRPLALLWVAGAQRIAGDQGRGKETIKMARDAVDAIPEDKMRVSVWFSIANGLAHDGDCAGAREVLSQVIRQGVTDPKDALGLELTVETIVEKEGVDAELGWIKEFARADVRALAYAGAALGMVHKPGK